MNKILILLLLPVFVFSQKEIKDTPFTFKEFKNLVNYFETKKDLLNFFDFKSGDVIADIGAGEGEYEGAFSLLFDSLTFYIQDVNQKILNQKKLDKIVRHYSEIKGSPQTNRFQLCLGTEKTTNLPDTTFDKVIMLAAIHEFTFMDDMIEDISKKLKPNGKVYIIDPYCTAKGHVNYTSEEITAKMEDYGFTLIKMQKVERNNGRAYEAVFLKSN